MEDQKLYVTFGAIFSQLEPWQIKSHSELLGQLTVDGPLRLSGFSNIKYV